MANILALAWARYLKSLERKPLATKVGLAHTCTTAHGTAVPVHRPSLALPPAGDHSRAAERGQRRGGAVTHLKCAAPLAKNPGDCGRVMYSLQAAAFPSRCSDFGCLTAKLVDSGVWLPVGRTKQPLLAEFPGTAVQGAARRRHRGEEGAFLHEYVVVVVLLCCCLLEHSVPGKLMSSNLQVVLDQTTYGPLCNILLISCECAFVSSPTDYQTDPVSTLPCVCADLSFIVEGRSAQTTKKRLQRDYPNIQKNGWKVWPIAALINYRYVPVKLRVLFVNVVAFCW